MALDENPSAWITRRDAAETLKLTERQVDRLIRDGVLQALKNGLTREVRITAESMTRVAAERAERAAWAPITVSASEAAA